MVPAHRLVLACLAVACFAALAGASAAGARTVWLCKPGMKNNPCTSGLSTTRFSPAGAPLGVRHLRAPKHPKIDCFYVYPTVSDQPTLQANLHIDPVERSVALYQAGYYSRECRIFAPMYRQVTFAGILASPGSLGRAGYGDVVAAWRDYLARYNHGRGVVLIGHSQGSFVLRKLVAAEIDRKPSVRRRLVSAILLGGGVQVRRGSDVGGDFQHVRACHSSRQLGCVLAFSTFNAPVPANSLFGRTTTPGDQVLCTNPAAFGGGSGLLDSISPRAPFAPGTLGTLSKAVVAGPLPPASTPWLEFAGSYRAQCSSADGANVLQVTGVPGARELKPTPDATWGLHLVDSNIALGNLVDIVGSEAAAYAARAG